jgi:hypothetical protein
MQEVKIQPQSWVVDDDEESGETEPVAYSFSYARA